MNTQRPSISMMVIGTVIFVAVLGAWLFAEMHDIPGSSGIIFTFAGPVVTALFLSGRIGQAADAATQAAIQTNGTLEQRVQTAVSKALAVRDAARTRQELGDIGATPTDTTILAKDSHG